MTKKETKEKIVKQLAIVQARSTVRILTDQDVDLFLKKRDLMNRLAKIFDLTCRELQLVIDGGSAYRSQTTILSCHSLSNDFKCARVDCRLSHTGSLGALFCVLDLSLLSLRSIAIINSLLGIDFLYTKKGTLRKYKLDLSPLLYERKIKSLQEKQRRMKRRGLILSNKWKALNKTGRTWSYNKESTTQS